MFDLYADLAGQAHCPADAKNAVALASGFVDGCTAWSTRERQEKQKTAPRDEARSCYMNRAKSIAFALPDDLDIEPRFDRLPDPSWVGLQACFTLETPWYSKDDRPFHVLDNPVRKDRVFGVPFMAAASWKGLLRWACRMNAGLFAHLEKHDGGLDGWVDPPWLLHLFGNEKGEDESFQRGALAFYPTWFSKVDFRGDQSAQPNDPGRYAADLLRGRASQDRRRAPPALRNSPRCGSTRRGESGRGARLSP